ncbi:unnamed protein product [Nezara viridula]|uniref:Neuropeptide n=1 Tax=Nezara viridula TaxID=85310 RepID=A0A9P0HF09_NEZVI|nr:unnamed protein product [Nezara viridula]
MNTKLCAVFAFFCVVQSVYSAYLYALDDFGEENSESGSVEMSVGVVPKETFKHGELKPCQPGFCCPIDYECGSLYCYNSKLDKEHDILVC